jgi:hypothetical protein
MVSVYLSPSFIYEETSKYLKPVDEQPWADQVLHHGSVHNKS